MSHMFIVLYIIHSNIIISISYDNSIVYVSKYPVPVFRSCESSVILQPTAFLSIPVPFKS